ncbi:hypothetical protein [Euhalothece natronophila]|nr:hypothetical protein [Euhalothece natronophila]
MVLLDDPPFAPLNKGQGCFILGVKIESDRLKPLWSGAIAIISSDFTF